MKKKAARIRPSTIALPGARLPSVASSDIVEMPSKPRKLSTAIESADANSGAVITSGFQIGLMLHSPPGIVPPFSAVIAR